MQTNANINLSKHTFSHTYTLSHTHIHIHTHTHTRTHQNISLTRSRRRPSAAPAARGSLSHGLPLWPGRHCRSAGSCPVAIWSAPTPQGSVRLVQSFCRPGRPGARGPGLCGLGRFLCSSDWRRKVFLSGQSKSHVYILPLPTPLPLPLPLRLSLSLSWLLY